MDTNQDKVEATAKSLFKKVMPYIDFTDKEDVYAECWLVVKKYSRQDLSFDVLITKILNTFYKRRVKDAYCGIVFNGNKKMVPLCRRTDGEENSSNFSLEDMSSDRYQGQGALEIIDYLDVHLKKVPPMDAVILRLSLSNTQKSIGDLFGIDPKRISEIVIKTKKYLVKCLARDGLTLSDLAA